MAGSQLSELQNMRVLLEEARILSRNLAYHRMARLETSIEETLEEVDRQVDELRAAKGQRRTSAGSVKEGIYPHQSGLLGSLGRGFTSPQLLCG